MNGNGRVGERAKGRWKSILSQLGVDERLLDGKHHKCPVSGEGDDRFRFSNHNGRGNFFCACNDGRSDGFKLLECKFNCDFAESAKMVESVIGKAEEDRAPKRSSEDAVRDLRMIQSAIGREHGAVSSYLSSRGIEAKDQPLSVLRQAKVNYGLRAIGIAEKMTAMVAKFVRPDGAPSTFHLTYLDADNQKASIERSRVVATPVAPMAGGAVRLHPMVDGVLGVAEGIESALSARALFQVNTWATLNATMLAKFEPPEGCRKIVIFADNDDNFTGQAAAYALARRCRMKYNIEVEVRAPLRTGKDYNDVLTRGA